MRLIDRHHRRFARSSVRFQLCQTHSIQIAVIGPFHPVLLVSLAALTADHSILVDAIGYHLVPFQSVVVVVAIAAESAAAAHSDSFVGL